MLPLGQPSNAILSSFTQRPPEGLVSEGISNDNVVRN